MALVKLDAEYTGEASFAEPQHTENDGNGRQLQRSCWRYRYVCCWSTEVCSWTGTSLLSSAPKQFRKFQHAMKSSAIASHSWSVGGTSCRTTTC